jgi:phosphatidate phosphatase APP1
MSDGMARFAGIKTALRRSLHHAARPARQDQGAAGLVVEPYRGYGNRETLYLMGRVYRQPGGRVQRDALAGDLRGSLTRLLRRGARDQTVIARFGDAVQRVVTDRSGYFHLRLELSEPPPADHVWHRVGLRLPLRSGAAATAMGEVFVPPEGARFVVISDIDDTVMYTGVANKLHMFWRLFAQGARSRTAFPGVAALYRALHGRRRNPLLYVSRGPWSIYSMLQAFFRLHEIPVGPVLFLRDWGVSPTSPLPRRARGHKLALIRDMLALYRELPFVLIGDAGQHDPETYARIVREHPGRVHAVYIRNVSTDPTRAAQIERLADEVLQAGSQLLLAADSVAMAEHAAGLGLVSDDTPARVAGERRCETGRSRRHPLRVLRRRSRRRTRDTVAAGELDEALDTGGDEPASTLVEAEADHRDRRADRTATRRP